MRRHCIEVVIDEADGFSHYVGLSYLRVSTIVEGETRVNVCVQEFCLLALVTLEILRLCEDNFSIFAIIFTFRFSFGLNFSVSIVKHRVRDQPADSEFVRVIPLEW